MFNLLKHYLRKESLLYACLLLWLIKGIMLSSLARGWIGEDELAHFGYANTLRRTGQWQVFEENWTTDEVWRSYTLLKEKSNSEDVVAEIQSDAFRQGRDSLSEHWIATGYQPPLYYWLLGNVLRLPWISDLDVLSWVYVLRYCSVVIGLGTILVLWKFLDLLKASDNQKILIVGFTVWQPMFSFLHSMINVDVLVIFEFSLWFYLVARGILRVWNWHLVVMTILTLLAGLFTKQSMLIPVVLTLIIWGVEFIRKHISWRLLGLGISLLLVCGIFVYQEYQWRGSQTAFFASTDQAGTGALSEYLFLQLERIRNRDFVSFWEMTLAFVPYNAPNWFSRFGRTLLGLSVVGLGMAIWDFYGLKKKTWADKRIILMGFTFISLVAWGAFVWTWDVLRFVNTLESWFKARYLFPMWVPMIWLLAKGWLYLGKKIGSETFIIWLVVGFSALYQINAWITFIISMN